MKDKFYVLSMLVICLFWAYGQQIHAQGKGTGQVDWVEGYISAKGQGTATPGGNRAKDQLRAVRAATILAQRALLEIIKDLRIDSKTTVENRMVKEDIIHSHVEGLIRGAEIVKQDFRWDGDMPIATVELRICISNEGSGCKSDKSIINALGISHKDEPVYAPRERLDEISAKQATTKHDIESVNYDSSRPVTGIIFDLQGMPFERMPLPVVITVGEGNKEFTVYSVKSVDPQIIRTYGVTRYVNSVSQARQNPYLGDNPMIVLVSQIIRENMMVISFDAARVIRETTLHGNDYLKQAKVIISAK
jgi:hypothetical protein